VARAPYPKVRVQVVQRRPFRGRVIKEDPHRINNKIYGLSEVRVVGDNASNKACIPFSQALRMAEDLGLDLVEISASAVPTGMSDHRTTRSSCTT
jgi:hypothetical protein